LAPLGRSRIDFEIISRYEISHRYVPLRGGTIAEFGFCLGRPPWHSQCVPPSAGALR
jgi:hypothetical protein